MTLEEIRELGFEELEKRSLEIAEETATADSEMLETLNAELDAIEERRNALNIEIEERKAAAEKVAEVIEQHLIGGDVVAKYTISTELK